MGDDIGQKPSTDAIAPLQEVDVGLAADVGTLQRLPKVIGNRRWVGRARGRSPKGTS